MIDISIILINYNTTNLLLACLKSVYKYSLNLNLEIIVVDNKSTNDTKDSILSEFPNVTFIQNNVNSGFSRANNIGVQAARGKYILLLNSDTLLIENTLEKCMNFMKSEENSQIGILGCKLLNKDLSLQYSFHWSAATFKKVIQENALYNMLFKNRIAYTEQKKIILQHQQKNDVEWLSGAFLLMDRKKCIENNFLLDEDFFMYSEDVELCRRVKKTGFKIIYYPETSIIHIGGGGANVPIKRTGQLILSEWLCILKTKGKILLFIYLILWRSNHFLDHLLYLKNSLLNNLKWKDKKQLLRRRFETAVFKKYFGTFMFRYSAKPNSNKQFLKYDAK